MSDKRLIQAKISSLGENMVIRRALPTIERRMIGAWCFLDHAGPVDVSSGPGMRVGPHRTSACKPSPG